MTKRATWVWIGGLSAFLGGLAGLADLTAVELPWPAFIFALLFFWAGGLAGLGALGRMGRVGLAGLILAGLGLGSLVGILAFGSLLPQGSDAAFEWAFQISLTMFCLGLALYGVNALRARPLPHGNGLPIVLVAGLLLVGPGSEALPISGSWRGYLDAYTLPVMGLSWMMIGVSLLQTRARGRLAGQPVFLTSAIALGAVTIGLAFVQDQKQACTSVNPDLPFATSESRRPVIVDADMAHEDMLAILYLLQHPAVRVEAITVAGTGEAHCGPGMAHAAGLAALHGRPDIPVACGSERPMAGNHEFPTAWRKEADALYGLTLPENPQAYSPLGAPDLIASVVQGSDQPVTLIALGPLTNLGQVLQDRPEIAAGLERIYVMGGAIELGGNVGLSGVGIENPVAEWNVYIDPRAANLVFSSGAPVTLVPLNATRHAPVTPRFHRCTRDHRRTPEGRFAYDMLTANYDFVASGGFQFWDSLTAAIATDPSLATFKTMPLVVVEAEGPSSGHTRPDANGYPVQVATAADGERFEDLFLSALNLETTHP